MKYKEMHHTVKEVIQIQTMNIILKLNIFDILQYVFIEQSDFRERHPKYMTDISYNSYLIKFVCKYADNPYISVIDFKSQFLKGVKINDKTQERYPKLIQYIGEITLETIVKIAKNHSSFGDRLQLSMDNFTKEFNNMMESH